MNKPIRIQRKRTKGWRMPPNTVYVGRPSGYANPFRVTHDRDNGWCVVTRRRRWYCSSERVARRLTVWLYRRMISYPDSIAKEYAKDLRGFNLACWCAPGSPCHGDVLLELANKDSEE